MTRYKPGTYLKSNPILNGCVHREKHAYDITKIAYCQLTSYDDCKNTKSEDCIAYFDIDNDLSPNKCTHRDTFRTNKIIVESCETLTNEFDCNEKLVSKAPFKIADDKKCDTSETALDQQFGLSPEECRSLCESTSTC